MNARIALVTIVLSGAATPAWQSTATAEIVAAHYPNWLEALSKATENDGDRHQCFAVYDAPPDGRPSTIIAAYTNTVTAALRVLRASPGGVAVIAEPRDLDLMGMQCVIDLIDVDADSRREIHLRLSNGMSTSHWLFKWDGQRLTNLTPLEPPPFTGPPRTRLFNGSFVDLDLDGRMEFYGGGATRVREGEAPEPDRIWRFARGAFVEAEPVIAALVFEGDSWDPDPFRMGFPLPAGALGPFTLEIRHDAAPGAAAVSGTISINGVEIVRPDDFRRASRLIERSVTLGTDNELTVRLAVAPGGRMILMLRSARWAQ